MFIIKVLFKRTELDDPERGCIQDESNQNFYIDVSFTDSTVKGLITQVSEFVGANDYYIDPCGDQPDRIGWQLTEDADGLPADDLDVELWEKGKRKLWLVDYSATVERLSAVDIAKELGQ